MLRLAWVLTMWGLLASCTLDGIGLDLASDWKMQSVGAWRDTKPEKLAFSGDGKWLYMTCRNKASVLAASLIAIDLQSGRQLTLLSGLHQPEALRLAPDGSLWIGEDDPQGLVWRIAEPDLLPGDQSVDRGSLDATNAAITPLPYVGAFAHKGLTFSRDGKFAYLVDGREKGTLFRFEISSRELTVWHADSGWLPIRYAEDARINAERLHAQQFDYPAGMETLPDGRVLFAESGSGRILMLDDRSDKPVVTTYLQHEALQHPDNLAWDNEYKWLWIADQNDLSTLWVWDSSRLSKVASHKKARISGLVSQHGVLYLNLQPKSVGAEITLKIWAVE